MRYFLNLICFFTIILVVSACNPGIVAEVVWKSTAELTARQHDAEIRERNPYKKSLSLFKPEDVIYVYGTTYHASISCSPPGSMRKSFEKATDYFPCLECIDVLK